MSDAKDYLYLVVLITLEVMAIVVVFGKWRSVPAIWRLGKPLIAAYVLIAAINGLIAVVTYSDKSVLLRAIPGAVFGCGLFVLFFLSGYLLSIGNGISAFRLLRRPELQSTRETPKRPLFDWLATALVILSVNLYALLIVVIFRPQPLKNPTNVLPEFLLAPEARTAQFLLFVAGAALYEEIVFRLFVQNAVEHVLRRTALCVPGAIVITAALWALGHWGMLAPRGVKELQIFGVGLILGYAARRYGLEVCILAHVVLNLFAFVLFGLS